MATTQQLLRLAASDPGYQFGQTMVLVGAAAVGLGLLGTGVAILLHKPKSRPPTGAERGTARALGGVLIVIGLLLPLYMAWSAGFFD